jgi:hypothetical protein
VEKSPLPFGGAAAGPPGPAGGGVGPLGRFGGPKSLKSKGFGWSTFSSPAFACNAGG